MVTVAAEWALLLQGIILVGLAAKAHGRQLRLERELAGHFDVTFTGDNPPFVEQLWARDRVRFWVLFAALAVLAAAYALPPWLARAAAGLPEPAPPGWLILLILLVWAFAGTFVLMGLWSLARFLRAARPRWEELRAQRAEWLRGALRGSAFWWAVVVVAGPLLLLPVL